MNEILKDMEDIEKKETDKMLIFDIEGSDSRLLAKILLVYFMIDLLK